MTDPQALSGVADLGPIPYLRLPDPRSIFARRAERFSALAPGHTLSEFLDLLSRLAAAQAAASATVPISLEPTHLRHERPLDAAAHRRGPEWRDALSVILAELSATPLPDETRTALELLGTLPPPELEALADRVLANAVLGADLAAGPFAAAALQVYFTALAAQVPADAVDRALDGCPVCGSLPVAGVVLGDDKLRYLACSLCGTQWHLTRVQCAACRESRDLRYYALERRAPGGGDGTGSVARGESGIPKRPHEGPSARAEACPSCKAYLKLFYAEADPQLEPLADDVATLSLDLLMAEEGWARHGVNLFLLSGEERAPAP